MARPIAPDRRAIPLDEWPSQDREAWDRAIAPGDPLDDEGPAAHWAQLTKRTNVQHYGRWLAFLARTGRGDPTAEPAERVTPEAVALWHEHLKAIVAPRTRLSMLVGLKVMMQAMAPDRNWRWLQDICNRVQRSARPTRDKQHRILASDVIYKAALAELEAVTAKPVGFPFGAIAYRDALMLALVAARPLRARNLIALELGRHLERTGSGWRLSIPGEETKTRQPLAFLLPESLVPWLERYLAEVRPLFPTAPSSNRLWLGRDGRTIGPGFAYNRIARLTERLFGRRLNPHLLRDCAASTLAVESPEVARMAAPLLGHRHFTTTERYYIQANNLDASRRIDAILQAVKASLPET